MAKPQSRVDKPMTTADEAEAAARRVHPDPSGPAHAGGVLILNADDWGRNAETTDRTLDCVCSGALSSVSAMVFMEDSERAAAIAREKDIDAGLHLNFTLPFSAPGASAALMEHQRRLVRYLRRHRFAPVMFHPALTTSFEYVMKAQREEFARLYGIEPARVDGHHHMHLCANVLWGSLLPRGVVVRRSFSFRPGQKGRLNQMYRAVVDRRLARRHRVTDFFFSLPPLYPERLHEMFRLARSAAVEVETHPVNPEEHRFLAGGEIFHWIGDLRIAPRYAFKDAELRP
jgi:predicted glycoside hydrolase/deacetylase ChbG (UPF0249 family)